MKAKRAFYQSRKTLLFFIAFIFLVQALGFLLYENISFEHQANISKQLIFNYANLLIQRLRESDEAQQKAIISGMQDEHIKYSITTKPVWPIHITSQRLWLVHNLLRHQTEHLNFSIQLRNQHWLNLQLNLMPGRANLITFIIGVELALFVLALVMLVLIHRYTVPLQTIQDAALQLGVDIHREPLTETGPAAVQDTYHAINVMQAKIQQLLQERNTMLAAIAHDLKTPLTRMRLRTDFITDKAQYQKNMRDIDTLDNMVEQLVHYAKQETLIEHKTLVDVNALIESLVHDYQDHHQAVTVSLPDETVLYHTDSSALKRIIRNLVDNALKYAGDVAITLLQETEKMVIRFDDNGPGIPDKEIPSVIMPFYRVNKARNQTIAGTGLGLAIVHNLTQQLGGELQLHNRAPHGLSVEVRLPKQNH